MSNYEKATIRDKSCEELEQWLELSTRRHNEVSQKARNYEGSEQQLRTVSSRSWEVTSLKG